MRNGPDNLRADLERTLSGAYTIERELGGGGMSRVFVANESALHRDVVVKVLHSDMSGHLSIERFRREISIAARLQHPHLVPLLTAGEVDGLPYFTMPFVTGESLRERLARDGELPLSEALRILREVASALAYAHANGVVHRDIKPDNVLLSGGSAMVTDFGVSKAVDAATTNAGSGITSVGMALGTPAYMAPEQASADPHVDQRADIYAWGILAYEMITGQSPFAGRTAQAMIAAHVIETPEDLARRRPSTPRALSELVMRCLEKRPADRPQSADEVVRALDAVPASGATPVAAPPRQRSRFAAIAATVALAAVALVAFVVLRQRGGRDAATPAGPMTLAVLPIDNVGGDSAKEYLADGMTTEMANALRQTPGLNVLGDLSTFRFKHTQLPPDRIAAELHAGMLLTGRMQSQGGKIRLWMQLTSADGKMLWAKQFDPEVSDNFALQDDITRAVTSELRVVLTPKAAAVARAGRTLNPQAHDLYQRGMFEKNKLSEPALNAAVNYFQQALKLDPDYAQAAAAMGFAYDMLADAYMPSHPEHVLAMAAAKRALASDSMLAEAHTLYGFELAAAEWKLPAGLAEMRRGLELDPNSPDGLFMYSSLLAITGQTDSALLPTDRLITIDPLSAMASMDRALVLVFGGRWQDALRQDSITKKLDPNVLYGDAWDGMALRELGRFDESVRAYITFQAVTGQPAFGLAMTYGRLGKTDAALRIIHQLEQNSKTQWVGPVFIAAGYASIGDRDRAMTWLDQAFREKDWVLRFTVTNASGWLRALSDDPRFTALRTKVLATTWSQ